MLKKLFLRIEEWLYFKLKHRHDERKYRPYEEDLLKLKKDVESAAGISNAFMSPAVVRKTAAECVEARKNDPGIMDMPVPRFLVAEMDEVDKDFLTVKRTVVSGKAIADAIAEEKGARDSDRSE